MNIENGRPDPQTKEEILNLLINDAKDLFGEDLNDTETAAIRYFYEPVAQRLVEAQESIGLVLTSTQIDYAQEDSLDLLTSLIGVPRQSPQPSRGKVTFYRDEASTTRDYNIPQGTLVRTDGEEQITFETTEFEILEEGETEVDVNVEAVDPGTQGNVGSNTITVMVDPPTGIDGVYNEETTSGGRNEETDDQLRERAKEELGEGSRATAKALVAAPKRADDNVRSVTIYTRSDNQILSDQTDNPGFELVVEGGDEEEIAQSILEHKASGDKSYAGFNGEAIDEPIPVPLGNGQTMDIEFSRPTTVEIFIEMDLETTDEYEGDDEVRKSIVEYIGGEDKYGDSIRGNLHTEDDVVHSQVKFAILSVDGVYDVPSLEIGTDSENLSTDNIDINDGEIAFTKSDDQYIGINEL